MIPITIIGMLVVSSGMTTPGAIHRDTVHSEAIAPGSSIHMFVLGGLVADKFGQPIAGARVQITELNRTTLTDTGGKYSFSGVASGTYRLSFAAIGFRPEVNTVTVLDGDITLDAALRPSLIELPTIQVTASANATDPLSSPQPTAVVSGSDLAAAQSPSLGETLNQVAGVHSLSTGNGIGKPVIRGLSSNRVLVLDNGQRMETQQWGDEHAPNVETANAERIEVIRGPASVLYGSDALGGVINVIQRPLPDALDRAPFVRGTATGDYSTNNRQPDGALLVEGASGGLGFRADVSGRTSENVRTPNYTLWHSRNEAVGGTGTLGYRGSWGSLTGTYTQRNERIQLTDEDPAAQPTQRISTNRARLDLEMPAGASRIEITGGFERSRRREFEDDTTATVALGLLSKDYTIDAHLHHPPVGRFAGTLGVSGQHTRFDKFGEETLIPNSRSTDVGLFGFEQMD
ncbi:MAG: TonB-dependent receptor, partial [Gemmatimonadota bacterium]